MKIILPTMILFIAALGCAVDSPKETKTRSTQPKPEPTMDDAAIIADVRAHIKDLRNDRDGASGYAIYTQLQKVGSSSPQYSESQKLLAQLKPQLAVAIREVNRDDYETAVQQIFSSMNGIRVKTVRIGGGYALMAYHSYFTSETFDLGDQAHQVQEWMSKNHDDLVYSGIVRVGVASNQGFGSQWYYVKSKNDP